MTVYTRRVWMPSVDLYRKDNFYRKNTCIVPVLRKHVKISDRITQKISFLLQGSWHFSLDSTMVGIEHIEDPQVKYDLVYEPLKNFCVQTLTDACALTKQVLPEKFSTICQEIKDFEAYEDDVWVIGHPKTGTNWVQEMVWLITHDLDFKTASQMKLRDRCPYIE